MKKILLILTLYLYHIFIYGQGTTIIGNNLMLPKTVLGIGTSTNVGSALLQLNSTTKGILIPRMNTAQMNAIVAPATGLLIYNTDSTNFCYFSSVWKKFGFGASSEFPDSAVVTDKTLLKSVVGTKITLKADTTQLTTPYYVATHTGSGTINFIPKFSSATTIGNSAFYQSGNNLIIPTGKFITSTDSNNVKIDLNYLGLNDLAITTDGGIGHNAFFSLFSFTGGIIGIGVYNPIYSKQNTIRLDSNEILFQGKKIRIAIDSIQFTTLNNGIGKVWTCSDALGHGDWATPTGGSGGGYRPHGTINYLSKFTPNDSTLGSSSIYDNGTSVAIGNASPTASTGFELNSTTKAILLSRMTATQLGALTPIPGMIAYNSTGSSFWGYTNQYGGTVQNFVTANTSVPTASYYSRWISGTTIGQANLYNSLSDWSRMHGLALHQMTLIDTIKFLNTSNTNAVGIRAGVTTTPYTLTWPTAPPASSGYALVFTTAGVGSFTALTSGATGATGATGSAGSNGATGSTGAGYSIGTATIAISSGAVTFNANSNQLQRDSLTSSVTSYTVTLSNFIVGAQMSVDYFKTTATDCAITFPANCEVSLTSNCIRSGTSKNIATVTSGTTGRFEITVIRCDPNTATKYKVYIAQDD